MRPPLVSGTRTRLPTPGRAKSDCCYTGRVLGQPDYSRGTHPSWFCTLINAPLATSSRTMSSFPSLAARCRGVLRRSRRRSAGPDPSEPALGWCYCAWLSFSHDPRPRGAPMQCRRRLAAGAAAAPAVVRVYMCSVCDERLCDQHVPQTSGIMKGTEPARGNSPPSLLRAKQDPFAAIGWAGGRAVCAAKREARSRCPSHRPASTACMSAPWERSTSTTSARP